MSAETSTEFEGWAILELMGHRRLGGYVREVELAGKGMLRIDVPGDGDEPEITQFYSPSAARPKPPSSSVDLANRWVVIGP